MNSSTQNECSMLEFVAIDYSLVSLLCYAIEFDDKWVYMTNNRYEDEDKDKYKILFELKMS